MSVRQCARCKKVHDEKEFQFHESTQRFNPYCNPCRAVIARARRMLRGSV